MSNKKLSYIINEKLKDKEKDKENDEKKEKNKSLEEQDLELYYDDSLLETIKKWFIFVLWEWKKTVIFLITVLK